MVEHTPCNCLPPWTECKECGEPWPCRDVQVADLQRQLQQAQEEVRSCYWPELVRQRDAAIKRGGQVSAWVRRYFVKASNERKRAEAAEGRCRIWQGKARAAEKLFRAAERDAAEQRALLLRIHKVCEHTLEGDRSSGWYRMVVFDLGQLTAHAEAQEEAPDD